MICKNKNREEDLKLLIDLGSGYSAGTPFRIVFYSGRLGRPTYVCEGDGNSKYTNCVKVDDTHVLCLLDNHDLALGRIDYKLYLYVPDSQMPDGNLRLVSNGICTFVDPTTNEEYCIVLTNGVSDTFPISASTVSLIGNVIKGQDADIAGCNTAIANANAVKSAMESLAQEVSTQEAQRQTNENQRIISENSRRDAEQRRAAAAQSQNDAMVAMSNAFSANMQAISQAEQLSQANENARKSAEAARIANESTRQSKEAERQSAEATRVENETARQEAETERKALAEELDNINVDFESNNLVITKRDGNTISLNVKGSDGVDGKGGLSFILDRQNVYLKLDSNGNLASRNKTTFKLTAYIGGVPANILKELDISASGCSPSPFEAPGAAVTPSSTISAFVMFSGSTIYSINDDAKIALTIYYLEGTDTKTVTMNLPIIAVKDGAQGIQGEKGDDADIAGCNAAIESANRAASSANAAAQSAQQAAGSVNDLALKTEQISAEGGASAEDVIIFEDDNGVERGHINSEEADFKNLKSNGVAVLTEHQDISGKADQTDLDDVAQKVEQISAESASTIDEEEVWSNDDETDVYASIGDYGIKAKNLYVRDASGNYVSIKNYYNNGYPDYYQNEMNTVLPLVQSNNLLSGANGDSFVFITDSHFAEGTSVNGGNSAALTSYIAKHTNNKMVVFGGDVLFANDSSSHSAEIEYAKKFFNELYVGFGGNVRYVFGNHDHDDNVTDNEIYSIAIKTYENDIIHSNNIFNYYFDNEKQKIRYIVVNTHGGTFSSSEKSWLDGIIKENGWNIVVFAHAIFDKTTTEGERDIISGVSSIVEMADALNNNGTGYESCTSKVMFILSGHVHNDYLRYYGTSLTPVISCVADGLTSSASLGDATKDQAMTFFDIDIANKKLKLVRFGKAGNFGRTKDINIITM